MKELLLDANEQGKREKSFLENVRGIAFLATPHSGSDLATLLQALQFVSRATPVAMDLAHNNPHLLKQRQRYQTWSHQNRVRHLVFREAEKTKNLTMVVPPDSADPVFPNAWAIPVEKDHFEICKPEDESSEVHVRVVDFLLELIHAPERNTSEEAVVLSRIEQAVALAREEGIDLKILTPIFENLGHQNLTPEEMKARAKDAVARIVERAVQTVSPSNEGADIDATIAAARAQLKTANTVAARALLDAKIAEEEAARHQRLLPLLRERYGIERLTFDYSAAKTTLTELSRLEPEKSWILIELGDIERIIGTLDAAERAFTNALTCAKSKSDRRHQSVALDRIGDVLVARNDLEGALKHYREGLDIRRVLHDQDKSNAERARDVALSLLQVGLVAKQQKDLSHACASFREGKSIIKRLMTAAPDVYELANDFALFEKRMKEADCPPEQ